MLIGWLLLARPDFRTRFDAMHAVNGPYAHEILERRLGAPAGTVVNGTPLPDFGGGHPDTNPVYAAELVAALADSRSGLSFGAASDGDGDRNMIVGRRFVVTPSDSLAVLAANAHLAQGYTAGLKGIARSLPTSAAADRVAKALGVHHYDTPTWVEVLRQPSGRRESHDLRRGKLWHRLDHVREKDGLWAVLLMSFFAR